MVEYMKRLYDMVQFITVGYGLSPMKVFLRPMVLSSWADTPKSTSFTSALSVSSTFCPLMSLCITWGEESGGGGGWRCDGGAEGREEGWGEREGRSTLQACRCVSPRSTSRQM